MSEISRANKMGKERKTEKTDERAERRRRAQTALLAVALGFAPFAPFAPLAAFAQTATSRAGNGLTGKFSIEGPVESAPSEEKTAPTETAPRAEFKAFLVGADKYDEAPQLPCVKRDVEEFAKRLIEIGFDKNNVTVLKMADKSRDFPNKANIEDRFEEFVESLEPGDFAVVFMSGHGLQNKETKEAFFAPVDLQPKKLFETAVSIDGMLARLEESPAKCRWMIVDACRNVPAAWETSEMRTRAVDGATPGLTSAINVPDSTILLQSCEPGEVSYEGGAGSDHGLFTQSLLEALDKNGSKADRDSDGVLKLTELFHYVAKRTNELAEQNGGTQNPTWSGATTDFEILTTLIEGLPPERWRKADELYQDARDLRREKKWRKALEQIKKAREINAVNKDYQAAEAEIQAQVDAIAANEKRAEADKLAEDAWTAFDLGGEANVEKAIRLMKESLELVDLAANRRGLKTFEEELEALRNPAPQPTPPAPQPTPSAPQPTPQPTPQPAPPAPQPTPQPAPPEPSPVASSVAWTEAHTAGTQKSLEIKGAKYNFRYCPAGTFTMGSPTSESGRSSDETQHEVTLTQGFWMLETEVTQALWESVTGENPMVVTGDDSTARLATHSMFSMDEAWEDDWTGPKKPVGNVNWEECQEFIEKLNSGGYAPAGLKFRLPTEAEWEYACRAGTSGPYAGSSLETLGWYKENSGGDNRDVGKKAPNAWGLYDMHGNVREWCSDWFDVDTYDAASQTDPTGPARGSYRVLRGGSWAFDLCDCRSAYRGCADPRNRRSNYGFRLVLSCEIETSSAASVATPPAPTVLPSPSSADSTSGSASSTGTSAASSSASSAWTEAHTAGTQKSLNIKGASYNFRYCPAGTFMMGSAKGEPGRFVDETQHKVKLTQGFWMLETEVTQALWESVTGENPTTFSSWRTAVDNVSWEDCQEFIEKLNSGGYAPAGLKFRLPTEAEWEYACRAGASVLKKEPNAWGLYDMHDSVWEWCSDRYGEYGAASQTDPTGPSEGSKRVLRGGSWGLGAGNSRSTNRNSYRPERRNSDHGFRLVLGREIASSPEPVAPSPVPPAPTVSVAWPEAPAAGTAKSLAIKGASYKFRYCPAGTFAMGSPAGEAGRWADETQHKVTLTQGFWMLETEVTQALWESVTDKNPMDEALIADSLRGPNKPVGNVSWEDCQEFIEKLNSLGIAPAGLKFRLPTGAEWEYACRAGTRGPYAASSLDSMGWYGDNSGGDNHDVGKKAPNAWGLYDMHGNVWEWCSDRFASGSYGTASQTDPTGPSSGSRRVLRGGGWRDVAGVCRSASRISCNPSYESCFYGLRLVLGREIASNATVATSDASSSRTPTSSTLTKILALCILSFYLIYAKRLRRRLDFSRLSSDGETGERSAEGAARFKRFRRRRARTETSGGDEADGRDAANGR